MRSDLTPHFWTERGNRDPTLSMSQLRAIEAEKRSEALGEKSPCGAVRYSNP